MKVGKSITKAIDEWQNGDDESAIMHACNAVDGTARKQSYGAAGNKVRFVRFLRENYSILGPMGMPGINVVESRFPIRVQGSDHEMMDLAEFIYKIHRCTQGHGDELPSGFKLISDANGPDAHTSFYFDMGKLRLSDRIIFGLIAVAMASPHNIGERVPQKYWLSFNGQYVLQYASGSAVQTKSRRS